MKYGKAFVYVSGLSYLAGFILCLLNYPPILNISLMLQSIVFVLMWIVCFTLIITNDEGLRYILSALWGVMAAFTFVGFVRWAPDGSAPYQLFMTAWDLAL